VVSKEAKHVDILMVEEYLVVVGTCEVVLAGLNVREGAELASAR